MVTATNSLSQVQTQLDNISNNIANVETVGYKKKQVNFAELLYQQYDNDKLDTVQRQSPVGIRFGTGAYVSQIQANQKQGSLKMTERDLDFAFSKENLYFTVAMNDGGEVQTAYTRQGNLYVSPAGNGEVMLVTSEGYSVLDSNGDPIYLPDDAAEFRLSPTGAIQAASADGQIMRSAELGVIQLDTPQAMQSLTGSYIGLPSNLDEMGLDEQQILRPLLGEGRQNLNLEQGMLESSNVDLGVETTNMIAAQRSYQFSSRALTMADQMLGLINGIR